MLRSLCCLSARNDIKPARQAGSSEEKVDPSIDRSTYPFKLHPYDSWSYKVTDDDFAALQEALAQGLDPNQCWTKDELVIDAPEPFGCVHREYSPVCKGFDRWNTPLHRALYFEGLDSASLLLEHGADINLVNGNGRTALLEAVADERTDNVVFLVQHGADLNKISSKNEFALQMALEYGHHDIFRLLIEEGADVGSVLDSKWTVVDLALLAGDYQALVALCCRYLEMKPSPLISDEPKEVPGDDHSAEARELLSLVTSRQVVPGPELYEAYRHVVLSMGEPEQSQRDFDVWVRFSESLYQAIFSAANLSRPTTRTRLCRGCLTFQECIVHLHENMEKEEALPPPHRRRTHADREELDKCAREGCPLCGLAADALEYKSARDLARPNKPPPTPSIYFQASFKSSGRLQLPERFFKMESAKITVEDLGSGRQAELSVKDVDERFILDCHAMDEKDTGTGSSASLETARSWLAICRKSSLHELCQQLHSHDRDNGKRILPTRVLDLTEAGQDPRLVEGQGIEAPYCTLSYCWGNQGQATALTVRANLAERVVRVALDSLPTLMKEAVQAARYLGYKYLWIDALCIIQDDEHDWNREVAKMGAIYSNCDLVITSLVAKDSQDHLLQPRSLRVPRPVPLDIWLPQRLRSRQVPGRVTQPAVYPAWATESDGKSLKGPVNSRGWALQEHVLSPRILYFGAGTLHWECMGHYGLDADPDWVMPTPWNIWTDIERRMRVKCAIRGITPPGEYHGGDQTPDDMWERQVAQFTIRDLSKQSDRIPAILGMAKSFEKVFGQQFLGGIWKGDKLLESLCWWGENKDNPTGPSWTWASVSGHVSFSFVRRGGIPQAEVISIDVETNESQSRISGSITLRGALHKKLPMGNRLWFIGDSQELIDRESDKAATYYAFDMIGYEHGPPFRGYGHPLQPHGSPAAMVRLLLQPVVLEGADAKQLSVFRRVGIGLYECGAELANLSLVKGGKKADKEKGSVLWTKADRLITIV
ncbi:heterokaryon incompatibility [Fusarium albosuccineum]|uniref:Heterokaryon incompatibility n=1 Tax=Fusarium albosuccineum TaxID=1237068 RepID=A0A8H4KHP0_9HYPO|nr:heterokaryon incompatibility [Fusarium albosuccineum]